MKHRWWIIAGAVTVVAIVVSVAIWANRPADDKRYVATLNEVISEPATPYLYPQWWSDGESTLRFSADAGGLLVSNPHALVDLVDFEHTYLAMPIETPVLLEVPEAVSSEAKPAAIAAGPGGSHFPWVAVAFASKTVGLDDFETTERPLVWIGTEPIADDDAASAIELPVELRSNESDGHNMLADAAIVTVSDAPRAIVTTKQKDAGSLHSCAIDACEWEEHDLPGGAPVDALGSTGDAVVAVTGSASGNASVWYASGDDLAWQQIGSAPEGAHLAHLQESTAGVALIWQDDEDGETFISIDTVRTGALRESVAKTPVNGHLLRVNAAESIGEHWFLGGSRPNENPSGSRWDTGEAEIWVLADAAWEPLDDPFLGAQVDQEIELLYAKDDQLYALSNASLLHTSMIWHFGSAD